MVPKKLQKKALSNLTLRVYSDNLEAYINSNVPKYNIHKRFYTVCVDNVELLDLHATNKLQVEYFRLIGGEIVERLLRKLNDYPIIKREILSNLTSDLLVMFKYEILKYNLLPHLDMDFEYIVVMDRLLRDYVYYKKDFDFEYLLNMNSDLYYVALSILQYLNDCNINNFLLNDYDESKDLLSTNVSVRDLLELGKFLDSLKTHPKGN